MEDGRRRMAEAVGGKSEGRRPKPEAKPKAEIRTRRRDAELGVGRWPMAKSAPDRLGEQAKTQAKSLWSRDGP
jgi:hypothetical protein